MDKANTKPSKASHKNQSGEFARTMRKVWQKVVIISKRLWQGLRKFCGMIYSGWKDLWHNFLRSFARWADPRLEPYRDKVYTGYDEAVKIDKSKLTEVHSPKNTEDTRCDDAVIVEEQIYNPPAPETREDLFALLREAPMSVLTSAERKAMAAVLSLPDVEVREIMTPATKIVFVKQDETLGPLVLDRLYRSGFTHFPVIEDKQQIIGTLETNLLNSLDSKETRTAEQVMDPRVYYIRTDYTLEQTLKAFLRTNSHMMLVIDNYEKLMGMLAFAQLVDYLFSEKYRDDFDRDSDRIAVAKRK